MEIPSSLLTRYTSPVKSRETERGELQKEIMETINIGRKGTIYKPLSMARVGMLIQHIPTKDLYYVISVCKDAGNRSNNYHQGFSKKFFYEIKAK